MESSREIFVGGQRKVIKKKKTPLVKEKNQTCGLVFLYTAKNLKNPVNFGSHKRYSEEEKLIYTFVFK